MRYNKFMSKIKSEIENKLEKEANDTYKSMSKYQTNPIAAKFASFRITKKNIKFKDLF